MSETFSTTLDPAKHPWMRAQGLCRLWEVFEANGFQARIVGGAIRDALIGRPVGDVDIAVNRPPDAVSSLLTQAGFKVIPIGYDFGTVMAVADGRGYEITSLRRDLVTDGRHAQVAYTDDWELDAQRRDFTVNALYADRNGRIYDYCGGLDDLAVRKIRFVGDPEQRIREDTLRILRYFRFLAQIEGTESHAIDTPSLKACRLGAPLMLALSGERVWRELAKWLLASNPVPSLVLAFSNDVFKTLLPDLRFSDKLAALIELETRYAEPYALRRLAALVEGQGAGLAGRLHLSRYEERRLSTLLSRRDQIRAVTNVPSFRRLIYDAGTDGALDLWLLAMADGREDLAAYHTTLNNWENPVFPVMGKDILALGLNQGPQVGQVLEQIKQEWIAADFQPDREACLAMVKSRISER